MVSHSKGFSLSCAAFLTKVSQWGFCSTEGLRGQLDGHTKTPACGLPASGATNERNWRGWVPAFKGSGQEVDHFSSHRMGWNSAQGPPSCEGAGTPLDPDASPIALCCFFNAGGIVVVNTIDLCICEELPANVFWGFSPCAVEAL